MTLKVLVGKFEQLYAFCFICMLLPESEAPAAPWCYEWCWLLGRVSSYGSSSGLHEDMSSRPHGITVTVKVEEELEAYWGYFCCD